MSPRARGAAALLGALLVAGCSSAQDGGTGPAPRATTTVTASAPATRTATTPPRRVPVGQAGIEPGTPVWVQGSVLHVGQEVVDLAPRRVDAFVTTRGGIYFLDGDELWFTDLRVVRATSVVVATDLVADTTGASIRVTTGGVRAAYEVGGGTRIAPRLVHPPHPVDRLGRPDTLVVRSERSDVTETGGAVPVRVGGGRFAVVDVEGGPLVAVDTTDDLRVPLSGVVGDGFELVSWSGPSGFYGLALQEGRPAAVLGCDLEAGSCRSYGAVDADSSLLLESGT